LAGVTNIRNFDAEFALTNRLRTEGTTHLLQGARAAGVRRFVAQSYGGWTYERTGTGLKHEGDRLDPNPPANQRRSLDAIRFLERTVAGAPDIEGLALRFGAFYGPGTGLTPGAELCEMVRRRRWPIIGDGRGVWSFVHIDDAAAATRAAVERGAAGTYNIADDDPARASEWLAELARMLGAKPPSRVPVWLGRLVAGDVGVSMMTQIRGMANVKAKRELDWAPRWRSWREGFEHEVARLRVVEPAAT
jgi:2-alkyl-3-oxoalkanoate reductase